MNDKLKTLAMNFASKVPSYESYGKVRSIGFEYDLDGALGVGEIIEGLELPKLCKILDAKIQSPTMGATGIFSLGLRDEDGDRLGSLIVAADAGGQAVLERADADSTDIFKVMSKKSSLILEVTEATVATSGTIKGEVLISVE